MSDEPREPPRPPAPKVMIIRLRANGPREAVKTIAAIEMLLKRC